MYVVYVYNVCTMYVQCMYNVCTMYLCCTYVYICMCVQCMYNVCTMYVVYICPRNVEPYNKHCRGKALLVSWCRNEGPGTGPFFFHGFLSPISRAREIENDEFHGHFTG